MTTTATQPQVKEFQSETKQVLRLVIHSLYSHREIFLRELISNASDACEKLRFEALANPSLMGSDTLAVTLIPDGAAGTLTIKDNGIGMSREEVIDNLGTIARSGTKKFLEGLSGDSAKDAQLIGQFGVGFYSAFIVADRVTVLTKRMDSEAVRWDSAGEGTYEIQPADKADRGTEVTLHLRDEDKEFLEPSRLKHLVRKYSDHLSVPILLKTQETEETLNQAKAFWTRPKAELKDEDYQAFYEHLTHDPEPARAWAHNKVEGNLEYTSLLYLPKHARFDLHDREQRSGGVQLYVRRVFIMDKAAELLPPWLRFMRGLVDTDDLPLNVSRELLQNNRTVEKIKAALVRRTLDLLEELAADKPAEYAEFWKTFGAVLKEGVIEDPAHKERVAKLLRFHSTAAAGDAAEVTLAQYVSRMKPDQKSIYYLTADTLMAARNSPHLEGFRARGLEVLLLTDRIDEWVASHLQDFEGKPLSSVASAARRHRFGDRDTGQGRRRVGVQGDARSSRQDAARQDRKRAREQPPHRIARSARRRRIRPEFAHEPHLEAGGAEQSVRDAADFGVESEASVGGAPEEHRRRGRFRGSRPCALRSGDARRGR